MRQIVGLLLVAVILVTAGCGNKKAPEKKETSIGKAVSQNPPAPDFTLTDLNGNTVTLSKLKGKVVVLDFWATWCGPCVRSFPAMQQAVNKYKNDPDVVFLFINTWERGGNVEEKVRQFIQRGNFDVQVLLDSENKVVRKYGVEGIPTKFVVDKQGGISKKSVGFSGSNDALIAELSEWIEQAK